ncbi:MAG: NAD(P)H-dependent oxidoreductase [Clostridia bacterium]|nr:NAD(P)H-dependent oxidoreductase [Clostridia bacterium]
MSIFGENKESYKDKKSLIIYFSRVGYIDKGNTEIIAEYVQEYTNADMFKVEPLVPYAKDYYTCINEAKQRIGNAPIKENLEDISQYEVIYIMSPIYWGTYAPEMETALKGLDFTGKTIRIVTTHEGSGLANVPSDVKRICKGANILGDAIAIKGTNCKSSKGKIESWI